MSVPVYSLYRLLWESLDWLFPPLCGGCNKPGTRLCKDCISKISLIKNPICPKCGETQEFPSASFCMACREIKPVFDKLRSWAEFSGPMQNALHRLKYQKDIALGDAIAQLMVGWLSGLSLQADIIVPIPLSDKRLRERGYNQVDYIAHPLALAIGLPYKPSAVVRVKDTASQVGLSRVARQANVSGAFRANQAHVNDKVVLVVDDVATTGATMNSCALALLNGGAHKVYGITTARAIRF